MSLVWTNLDSIFLALSLPFLHQNVSNYSLCFLFPFHSRGRGLCLPTQVEVPLLMLWIVYPPIALELNIQSLILKECFIFQECHLFGIYICSSYTYNNYKQNKTKYTIPLLSNVCIHLSLKGGTHCQWKQQLEDHTTTEKKEEKEETKLSKSDKRAYY